MDKENAKGTNENPKTKSSWFTTTNCLNGLLLASVIQLTLGILLYLIGTVSFMVLLIEGAIALVLAFLSNYKGYSSRLWKILLRILFSVYLFASLAAGIAMIIFIFVFIRGYKDPDLNLIILDNIWLTLALIVIPPLLFLQPALSVMAKYRKRYDLVLVRIAAITVFILSVILCVFILNHEAAFGNILSTSVTYTPVIFGHQMNINIAIDNIFTRILFCLCSGAFVVFAFKLKHINSKSLEKSKQP
ncbi:MAG: hypothetical protein PHH84_08735 [Oscillospiraceae bacterium]|nr:hypothetical protein [Oscillospiraceae bacterium]MDD4414487.1 hypothetical protein [Oscillospiraceae bacterium]